MGGPITEKFAKKHKVISRTIQIRGDQTLEDLHFAIFVAFGREEEHMYEFEIGGKGPMDAKARRTMLPAAMDEALPGSREPASNLTRTTPGLLGLKVGDVLGYWFDFCVDWRHQIDVVEVGDVVPGLKYPRVTKRVGESPPQYADLEEED